MSFLQSDDGVENPLKNERNGSKSSRKKRGNAFQRELLEKRHITTEVHRMGIFKFKEIIKNMHLSKRKREAFKQLYIHYATQERPYITKDEFIRLADEQKRTLSNAPSPSQIDALQRYKGGDYTAFNEYLREADGDVEKLLKGWLAGSFTMHIWMLSTLFDLVKPTTTDFVVYRGDGFEDAYDLNLGDYAKHMSKSFISTSYLKSVAERFMQKDRYNDLIKKYGFQCCIYEIIIPKGSRVLFVMSHIDRDDNDEMEVLLPPKSTFYVLETQIVDKVKIITLVFTKK